ncbi:hypothetical protein AgCh_017871 [Apium graveolens]
MGKWKLFVDGSIAGKKCGVRLILSSPEGLEICQVIQFDFPLTNNEAEYEALLAGMELARSLEAKHLRAFSDSMLVVKHFSGEYEQRDPQTKAYATKVKNASLSFETFELSQIDRENNSRVDSLSRLASAETQSLTESIYLTEAKTPSIEKKEYLEIHQGTDWMTPIQNFLEKGILPLDRRKAIKIRYRASSYTIANGRIYRRFVSQPILRCLNTEEQHQALEAVHEGICGEHLVGRSLAFKIICQGFFWPTLQADASEYAKKCEQCQLFATVPKQPPEERLLSLAPFHSPCGPWVEARPLSAITEEAAKKFFLEQIILIFGIPKICVSDNETHFVGNKFRRFLHHFGVQQKFSSFAHPLGNKAIEAANKIIFQGIKKRLGEAKGRWAEELPWVLWAYRTTPKSSTGETPFRLAYGTDTLVPVKVGLESYRTEVYNVEINNFGLTANVDLLEEEREVAHQGNMKYLMQTSQHYDSGIKKRSFGVGDLALRELVTSLPTKQGKLQPNWEGPYKVTEVIRPGTYVRSHFHCRGGEYSVYYNQIKLQELM